MSKLDLIPDEETLFSTNELYRDSTATSEMLLNQGNTDNFSKMDIDLQAWREVFEEDQVTMEGCR